MAINWKAFVPQYKISWKLAYPVMVGQLGQIMVSVADSIMVGRLLGTHPLAGISFAISILIVPMVFAIGIAYGLTPFVAGADGANKPEDATKYLKNGLVLNIATGIAMTLIIWLSTYFLDAFGQDPEVVFHAKPYILLVGSSLIPMMGYFAFKQFAEGLSDTKAAMRVSIVCNLLNIALNYPLITGWGPFPELGLMGAALSTFSTRILMMLGMIAYVRWMPKFKAYWTHWRTNSIEWSTLREIWTVGAPSGLQFVFEAGAFGASGVIVGMIGAKPQAAHQIALNIASISYMIVSGLGASATIRVGNQLGKRDFPTLRLAAQSIYHLTGGLMAITMTVLIVFREYLPTFYSQDAEVLAMCTPLMIAAGIFQFPDGYQATSLGTLRGIKDMRVPTVIAFFSYWVFALPLCYFLGVVAGYGALGVWIGLTGGLTVASIALYRRFQSRVNTLQES